MDASVTFRLPRLAVHENSEQTTRVPDPQPSAQATSTDEELVFQISFGSREALAVLFRRYGRLVRGVAYRVLKDASEADDLLQISSC
jgi:hypothetical protein